LPELIQKTPEEGKGCFMFQGWLCHLVLLPVVAAKIGNILQILAVWAK